MANDNFPNNLHLDTLAVRTALPPSQYGENSEALFLTSGYVQSSAASSAARFAMEEEGFTYSRVSNPTVTSMEMRLAALEGTEAATATATGMAAILLLGMAVLRAGDHVVCSQSVFGSVIPLFGREFAKFGVETTFVPQTDLAAWKAAIRPNTKLLFAETPTNPLLEVCDIQALADMAHNAGAYLALDNCFATPVLQRPARMGADFIIHSGTKFLDGQGRVMAGAICCTQKQRDELFLPVIRSAGMVLAPFNAWVILKGMETLSLRVNAQSDNALALARWLEAHPKVERVYHPGLASHPQHDLAMRQQSGRGGSVLSFAVKATDPETARSRAFHVLDSMQVLSLCTNLGDTKTLASHPASTSHGRLTEVQRQAAGIGQGLVRVAVGLDHIDDITADLARGLDTLDMITKIRTRIAPSPTGFLHLGTARTALYSWAYARHFGGEFVLRIEDTDVARSTKDSVDQILASMRWLGLEYDEGPVYQMQRLDRYKAVVDQLIAEGKAYHCYSTPEELDAVREAKKARGEKTLYDGTWRPAPGKALPPVPEGVKPVVRFCNPQDGDVTWNDLVKGPITISNREIDDLIIVRTDGIPTYNFAVVVDDWDMQISHVFRGDEHINNTPWQINIFNALGAALPQFGHCPVILGDDGQKLSKRRGAVSVTAYEEGGYLPEAMLNYLARLGWSHGDEELFTREQLVSWFDGTHLNKSPAQWDPAKLLWVNAQYIKQADNARLAGLVAVQLGKQGVELAAEVVENHLPQLCALLKDRCDTTVALATWAAKFYREVEVDPTEQAQHVTDAVKPAIALLQEKLTTVTWDKASIAAAIKEVLGATGLKMPQLAMPVRVLVMGTAQTPSLDAVLELSGREKVLVRLAKA